ncbi:Isoleucyl-tRNA synthetase [Archaeoglobus sulfaticallidus PM70-1]|uniref:Isoleucine--tRNA ligase n=1 Tax=Archaeoglobus sulfaticallidus PM70-1 TaxID=387631 RepID=N0BEX8_9EURY|nr:Isoleucyl-tRNA synthetase [Archaeoglobus sulfaticallidus PM70-1]
MAKVFPKVYNPEMVAEEIEKFWKENKIYERVKNRGDRKFFFVDGPPYTTGRIHLGTAWNKVLKDSILRYRRMMGYRVTDTPGWDMHGLPIEVKVEQELGFRSKKDIEDYGIDKFVEMCLNYALKNKKAMEEQFKMLGVWMDWDNPYMTIKADYINAAWWTIKQGYERGLLEKKQMVVNWCPRCETALADAEVEYWDEKDPSIYVKFPLKKEEGYIVIWTTTPWTLPANMAVAVHPSLEYAKIKAKKDGKEEILILAKELADNVLEKAGYDSWEIVDTFLGEDLVGLEYEHPLFEFVPEQKKFRHAVYMAEFVSAENTGCVHIAPGHGLEDYELGLEHGLDIFNPVDDRGVYTEKAGKYAGINVRDANQVIIEDLKEKGLLLAHEHIVHRYGHCWRCKSPIIYRSTEQWFLKVSELKDKMIEEIEKTRWIPSWAGEARFKDWVGNAKDWCISRQRYWGIPIPVWVCEKCGKMKVVGDINEIPWESDLDLHRPKVDEVTFDCECGGKMKRVPDVFDVWFDSGVASWGTLKYPRFREDFENLWPADFITEGHDQTRGWFYSQLGASVIAFGKAPYKTVLMHGFTLDEQGRKMSKSLGNVVEPEDVVKEVGVDSFRLYVLSSAVWEDLRFSWDEVRNINRVLNIFWNAIRFAHTYMSLDRFRLGRELDLRKEDRWILSRLENLNMVAKDAYENYSLHRIVRAFLNFVVEDFSRWYIQLVRPVVWEEKDSPSKLAVYTTILKVVDKASRIIAPIAPYLAEWIYINFVKAFRDSKESIFLERFPEPDKGLIDNELEEMMDFVRDIVESASNARQKAKKKLRWPLRKLIIESQDEKVARAVKELEDILKAQCNVKEVEVVSEFEKELVAKPNFKKIGPLFKDRAKEVAEMIRNMDSASITEATRNGIEVFGQKYRLEEIAEIEAKVPEGYEYSEFRSGWVYITTELDEELLKEAYAREIVRRVQEMRKELDLDVEEFIEVGISESEDFVKGFSDYIKNETRAESLRFSKVDENAYIREWDIEGIKVRISIKRLKED